MGSTSVSRGVSVAAEVNSYEAWFRAQVQDALDDARAATPHTQAMQAAQALIDAMRRGRS
jgi:DNA-damage-inducible protein J